jgi:uncharacterized protein (DUF427 family)
MGANSSGAPAHWGANDIVRWAKSKHLEQCLAGQLAGGRPDNTNLHQRSAMKAIWKNTVIAESDDTVVLEGNHYFPESSLKREFVTFSNHKTTCAWKGQASYLSLLVDGELKADAIWYYADPRPQAEEIRGRVAFGNGIQVKA